MSDVKWTDAQRRTIEDEGGALLVNAAAGSGKTAVLVERAARLVCRSENPIPADRLLILTFTNAAAEELRSRIAARLDAELRRRGGDIQLQRQRMLLKRAFIGTIDAFCIALVREHFAALDVAPDVAVADAALLQHLSDEVLAEVMEEMYADADFAAFAALYGAARSDWMAEKAVLALYQYTLSLPMPAVQLQRFADMYRLDVPLGESPWGREIFARADEMAESLVQLLQKALLLCQSEEALAANIEALKAECERAQSLAEVVEGRNWDEVVRTLDAFHFAAMKPVRSAKEETKAAMKAARDEAKKTVEELRERLFACSEAEYEEDLRAAAPLVAALCRAAGLYAQKFLEAKRQEKVLDFADFEHLALELLRGEDSARTPLCEKVSARYDAVMVDEYQDTNELQAVLYEHLARADGGNLFYVGDVKQSIYRFRKANPEIFLAQKEAFMKADAPHPAVIDLSHNFRSAPRVVQGVNFLFQRLMSPGLGEVAYEAGERLVCGGSHAHEGGFELALVESEGSEGEAAFVAGRIARMVKEGYMVQQGDGQRPCTYGDFCILMRAKTKMPVFVAALEAAGIPVTADMADELLLAPEVLPLAETLAAIDNPGDDVSLAAAMMGPLFRFTAGEMTALRAGAPRGRLWGAVCASNDEKARDFVQKMRYYRTVATGVDVGRLCEELAGQTGYLSAVAAMEFGTARLENLRRFMAWAGSVGAAGRGGLSGFVRLVRGGAGPQSGAAKSVPGHVSLMTIHKSKGLEFPVCFLADAAHAFNRSDLAARVQMDTQLGVGLSLRQGHTLYPALPALAIRSRAAHKAASEEMRVLYVALTRAKQQMIVSFAKRDLAKYLAQQAAGYVAGGTGPQSLRRMPSMADWLVGALMGQKEMAQQVKRFCGVDMPGEEGCGIQVTAQAGAAVAPAPRKAFHLTAQADAALVQRLLNRFAQSPPRRLLSGVPAKLSVSEIAKDEQLQLRRRPAFMYKEGLSAAEKGSAQHAFMQFANHAAAKADVEKEVARLVREGFLSQPVADAIDREGVRVFYASPLYARLQKAQRVLREYDFIMTVPAGEVQDGLPKEMQNEAVLVQGIADLVLVQNDEIEIVDYKTDHGVPPQQLVQRYHRQLQLYARAIQARLGLRVARLTIWAFAHGAEVDVPL